jgi:hypothetical protein
MLDPHCLETKRVLSHKLRPERLTDLSRDTALVARSRRNLGDAYLTHAVRSFSTTEPAPAGPAALISSLRYHALYQGTTLVGPQKSSYEGFSPWASRFMTGIAVQVWIILNHELSRNDANATHPQKRTATKSARRISRTVMEPPLSPDGV